MMDVMGNHLRTYPDDEVEALRARLAVVERDNEALAAENARLAADAAESARAAAAASAEAERLRAREAELERRIERIAELIREANARAFSPGSERSSKVAPGQESLFNDVEAADAGDSPEPGPGPAGTRGRGPRKAPKKVDWSGFAEVTHVTVHELPEGERSCPACGGPLEPMGFEVTRTFRIVPAHVEVEEHRVAKYVCPACSAANAETGGESPATIVRAQGPALPLPGTHASASLLAHVIRQKYELALPVNRIWRDLDQLRLPVTRQTLCSWVIGSWREWLAGLESEMWRQVRLRDVLQIDETTVQVLKEPGRAPERKSYVWVVATSEWDGPPAVHYEYHDSRRHEVARGMLAGCSCVAVSDGYGAYDDLGPGVGNSRCLAHARRKFADIVKGLGAEAARAAGSPALEAIGRIGAVYAVERRLGDLGPAERARARCERAWPLVLALVEWAAEKAPLYMPGMSVRKALDYLLDTLNRMGPWLADGRVPIDNNACERAVRPFAVGRRNWLFSDTVAGAEASCGIYSVVETARRNGLHSGRYVEWLLDEMPKARPSSPGDYARFLPWSDEVPEFCRLAPGEGVPDQAEAIVDVDPEMLNPE